MENKPKFDSYSPENAASKSGMSIGDIVDYSALNQSCTVRLQDGQPLSCFWLTGALTNFLGIKTSVVPEPGATVVVFHPSGWPYGLILGGTEMLPAPSASVQGIKGVGFEAKQSAFTVPHGSEELASSSAQMPFKNVDGHHPYDIFSGDYVKSNEMGIMFAILKTLAMLKASDLCQIRLSALDDMATIISHNFAHFSSFGEFRVINDEGELTMTMEGSHHENEAMGSTDAGTAAFVTDDKNAAADGTASVVKPAGRENDAAIGLWRLKAYVGYLGDFINMFILKPMDTYGKLKEAGARDAGLCQFYIGTDGTVDLRSTQSIGFEKCARIVVPKKLREASDPEGDRTDDEYDRTKAVKTPFAWQTTKHPGIQALQLRDYGAHLHNVYSVTKMKQHSKDWYVGNEAETPSAPTDYDTNATAVQTEVLTTVKILADGSVVVLDGSGNTVFLDRLRGHLSLASAKDIQIEAGRNVNIIAGNDFIVKCRNSADISCTNKDLRLKSGKNMMLLADKGGILVESKMEDVPASTMSSGGEAIVVRGIVLRSKYSVITLYGNAISLLAEAKLYLESKTDQLRLLANQILNVLRSSWMVTTENAYSAISFGAGGSMQVMGQLKVGGSLSVTGAAVKRSGTKWSEDGALADLDKTAVSQAWQLSEKNKWSVKDSGITDLTFQFRKTTDYRLDAAFEMFQTPAQQALARADTAKIWTEVPEKDEYPYPGKEHFTGKSYVTYTEQFISDLSGGVAKTYEDILAGNTAAGVQVVSLQGAYQVYKIPGVDDE